MQVIDHPDSCHCGYFKIVPPKSITVLGIEKVTTVREREASPAQPVPQEVTAKPLEFKHAVIFKIDCPTCSKSLFVQND